MVCTRITKVLFALHVVVLCSLVITCTNSVNTLFTNQSIKHGETIVSPKETFELGFFTTTRNSTNYYVGIWYKKISNKTRTVVWVANRNTPLTDNSSKLTLTVHGALTIQDAMNNEVWSSENSSTRSVRNRPFGQLLETGNFIINEEADIKQENPIWQSFDYITDTLLPGMKHGWNLVTGFERHYTAWKSSEDPAAGEFSCWLDKKGYPQTIVTNGAGVKFRAGPWNGVRFSGVQVLKTNKIFSFEFVINQKEVYYQYNLLTDSAYTRLVLQPSGNLERLIWIDSKQEWNIFWALEKDHCDHYNVCGPFGSCDINNNPVCDCLKGFEPTSPEQWRVNDWSLGCRRMTPLNCGLGEGFKKYSNLKLPDTHGSWYNQSMTTDECERMCKSNCSCTAYTNSNISGPGSGCLLWFGDLIDIRSFDENGDSLYIRFPSSELESSGAGRRVRVIVPIASAVLFLLVTLYLLYWSKRTRQKQEATHPFFHFNVLVILFNEDKILSISAGTNGNESGHDRENNNVKDLELLLFGLPTLIKATNNFSVTNKLGEGGFGPVYKGVLEDGQEIAVKRLAKASNQGLPEFKNEVMLISKLQHRNLVKLLGWCIKGDEKMLIYEYMPNKGLDTFIFDNNQSKLLDWSARYRIINGIARGLLYLHQDSRLRIIHRDLKVSNILLDADMNPKISDFGMARSFGGNQNEANTTRVVGTYGYMSPEYAGNGIFSIKSDVYSFGVLMLELVCGEKNRGFVHKEHSNSLIGHVWVLHKEGRSLELVAMCSYESINASQVLRSIHVGLLCVQRRPEDRPPMTSVIMMLGSENPLPSPQKPGFFIETDIEDTTHSSSSCGTSSTNELSITMLDGR
uniref:G-type lectin S-receptor-like serine/threonine-protein kinase At4g27290 n=1 Tax=Erigeron canadensis TaxID=72917 RepID=UPI001CB934D8|nr:G-type lectin S-receptor-like serine/threonine-protein kinase At4g27290 [Erigeron canadensis]